MIVRLKKQHKEQCRNVLCNETLSEGMPSMRLCSGYPAFPFFSGNYTHMWPEFVQISEDFERVSLSPSMGAPTIMQVSGDSEDGCL